MVARAQYLVRGRACAEVEKGETQPNQQQKQQQLQKQEVGIPFIGTF